MPALYRARTVDGIILMDESLTKVVEALADADGIERTAIATRQDGADLWHVYESPDALDADPDGLYWFAEIVVDVGSYEHLLSCT